MAYVFKDTKTVTYSSLATANKFSSGIHWTSAVNGRVSIVAYTSWGKAAGNDTIVRFVQNTTSTSLSGKVLLKIVDPSTAVGGNMHFPNRKAQTTTGGVMGSSAPVPIVLANERICIRTAASSGMCSKSVTYTFYYY